MSQFTQIWRDAEGEKLVIRRVDENGAEVAHYPKITLDLTALVAMVGTAGSPDQNLSVQWFYYKDAKDSCKAKKVPVLMGTPVDDV